MRENRKGVPGARYKTPVNRYYNNGGESDRMGYYKIKKPFLTPANKRSPQWTYDTRGNLLTRQQEEKGDRFIFECPIRNPI